MYRQHQNQKKTCQAIRHVRNVGDRLHEPKASLRRANTIGGVQVGTIQQALVSTP